MIFPYKTYKPSILGAAPFMETAAEGRAVYVIVASWYFLKTEPRPDPWFIGFTG